MSSILIADDHKSTCEGLALALEAKGHSVQIVLDGASAIEVVKGHFFDLLLVDIRMPKRNGIEVLEAVKAISPETIVIMMTAYGTIDVAVEAMQKGAVDFITKPYTLEQIELKVERALQQRRLRMENQYLREELEFRYNLDKVIGESPQMQAVYRAVQAVAPTHSTVLILGESGTGKELIARAIHQYSQRKEQPFIKVNCAALAEGVLESELFGHEKGAFTHAVQQKPGRFELANGGTLFLDEIGDIPLSTQVKLLRVLQEQEFERVGGTKTIRVDVRLITATNHNLLSLIREEKFREDLYYRLNVVPIEIPPLRERREDIPLLVAHFLHKSNVETGKKIHEIHPEAMKLLSTYSWPGNVRELENAIERAIVLAQGNVLTPENLSLGLQSPQQSWDGRSIPIPSVEGATLTEMVEGFEKQLLWDAYLKAKKVKAEASKLLGIERSTFRYKFDKYKL
ncbi:sigma-54-dependent Fis family transcriptional regulator, partial [Candidatus Poribacteria bacterium]|nr:sigma-54-dependent Fis family transcriptional regulator [Candidatus Poribacteria bacterium]